MGNFWRASGLAALSACMSCPNIAVAGDEGAVPLWWLALVTGSSAVVV